MRFQNLSHALMLQLCCNIHRRLQTEAAVPRQQREPTCRVCPCTEQRLSHLDAIITRRVVQRAHANQPCVDSQAACGQHAMVAAAQENVTHPLSASGARHL